MIGTKFKKNNYKVEEYAEAAAWANNNNAFIEDCGEYYEVKAIPAKSFDELKAEKLAELTSAKRKFDDNLVCEDMVIVSSLGFRANADLRSQNNIAGLLSAMSESGRTIFRDADNKGHELGIQDLQILHRECIANGQNLYLQAWKLESAINVAETVEDLNNIKIEFVQTDFSA